MKKSLIFSQFLFLVCLIIFSSPSWGRLNVFSKENFLKIEKQQLEKRYKGFYRHVERKKIYDKKRKAKLQDHKVKRQKLKEAQEARRRKFIKERKVKERKNIEALMEKRKQKRAEKRARLRKSYKRFRGELEYLRNTTRKIPENVDVGLESMDTMK